MNTTYFKNVIMGNVFSTATGTELPTTYYIGLSSTAPTADGTNVQLSSLTAPADGVISNANAINFPESLSDWFPASAPAKYYVIYDSKNEGNLLMYNQLTTSRIIERNTIATIKANSLYLQLTD